MKITEMILAQLTSDDTVTESLYQAMAYRDPNYAAERAAYCSGAQAWLEQVPGGQEYLTAMEQALASDLRCAYWAGFQWNLDCFRDPVNKLLLELDFEELCRERGMNLLPGAQAARGAMAAFVHSVQEAQRELLDPVTDYFAYLRTWGYKLAFLEGFCLADRLLPHLLPGYTPDGMLALRCEKKLQDFLGMQSLSRSGNT